MLNEPQAKDILLHHLDCSAMQGRAGEESWCNGMQCFILTLLGQMFSLIAPTFPIRVSHTLVCNNNCVIEQIILFTDLAMMLSCIFCHGGVSPTLSFTAFPTYPYSTFFSNVLLLEVCEHSPCCSRNYGESTSIKIVTVQRHHDSMT